MNITDMDMTWHHRRRQYTPSPSVLSFRIANNKDRTDGHHSRRQPPHMVGLHVNDFDIHDTSTSSFGWQRSSDKFSRISPAPDIVYRNRYLEKTKHEKSERNHHHRPSSSVPLKLNNSFSHPPSESSSQKSPPPHQYRTIYDYIRQSIRQIEQQRNLKQSDFSFRVQRPQNDDSTFRRVFGEKKRSTKTSLSRTSSTTQSSLFNTNFKSPQSFVNYINHSRVYQSPSYEQQ